MLSSIIRNPAKTDNDLKAQQKLELVRLRTAIALIERMRQAELVANYHPKTPN
jgi:hypothetical protein